MRRRRPGFTLVELLITITIISIMASMVVFAMFGAQEAARQKKTEALIARIDAILKYKWESYRTRRVNVVIPSGTPPQTAAKMRLDGLHDLMRLEMPDRWTDVSDDPVTPFGAPPAERLPRPAASVAYKRIYDANMTRAGAPTLGEAQEFQGAECLYLILRSQLQEDGDDISIILKSENIGDKDNDGFPEILDAWGTPIRFLRWAPGFISELQVAANGTISSDQTDPPRPSPLPTNPPTAMIDVLVDYGTTNVPYGEVISRGLSTTDAAYVGGAIVMLNPVTRVPEFERMARIAGYQYFPLQTSPFRPGFARFTLATSKDSAMQPFHPGGGGSVGSQFIVLPPDPFDPRHVYPMYPNGGALDPVDLSVPTFDLYPLVFSAGANKSSGIVGDVDSVPLQYVNQNVNPFFRPSSNFQMMGFQDSSGDWKDNIHNHMLGLR